MDSSSDNIRVLVVDDRPEKLLALEAILSDLPVELVRAHSGREALRCLLHQEFAAILLDVNMPGMDGFETAQLIRQRKSSERTPIIFVTAYHDEVFVTRGYSLGAVDYIVQPVTPEVLRSKVSVFVDLYRKTRQVSEQARWQQQRAGQLQKLASAAVAINGAPTMARTLQIITDSARDVIGSHQAITLFRLDDESAPMSLPGAACRAFTSFSGKYAQWGGRTLRMDEIASSSVATSRVPTRMTLKQLQAHADWPLVVKMEAQGDAPAPQGGLLAAPLIGRDGTQMGLIYLSDKLEGEFTADDEAILVQLSQMAIVAIENLISAEAREANRAKDRFIAVLSHELRTPLTPVLATVAALQADKRLPADCQDELRVIRRNVELEARLIDDLLDLTRISKGKIELHMSALDLHELIREAANICQGEIKEKAIAFGTDFAARQHYVKGDATRLQQVFWNLIKNAVKFTPPQGKIQVDTYNTDDGQICVRVTDTGIGIEPDVMPRIFNAFEQGRSSITRQYGGLGLGLSISRALIERHQGKFFASSEGKDKGATLTILLPITHEQPRRGTAFHTPRLAPAAPQKPVRLLLVEDHGDTARVMAKLLRSAGYELDSAATVTEALQFIKKNTYDILISDIGLPDGTGLDLMRQVRHVCALPGIALSGFGMEHDRKRSLDVGFSEHLTKPLNFQLLTDTIDRLTAQTEVDAGAPMAG